jgi:carbonic anhydrase
MSKLSQILRTICLVFIFLLFTPGLSRVLAAPESQQLQTVQGEVSKNAPQEPRHVSDRPHSDKSHSTGHPWSYDGSTGPEHWGELAPEFRIAKEGREQSPIDLSDSVPDRDVKPLVVKYHPCTLEILNNGHTIQVNVPEGNTLRVGEKEYQLLQFHFHTPSEHTLNRKHFPLEVHFVHKDTDGHLAVVGVFLKEGARNTTIEKIWDRIPSAQSGPTLISDIIIMPGDLLPKDLSYYAYSGSLTTPPCTEGVRWDVVIEPVEVSSDQIRKFSEVYPHNNRPVQPLFDRTVHLETEAGR